MIATTLGGRTVREWQAIMGADEFLKWQAYFNLTHFGELRADRRNAELLAMMFNVNRSPRQAAKTSDDFMVYKPRKRELTDDELENKISSFFGSLE